MILPVLPEKYYLTHFFELIDFLDVHYHPVFEKTHHDFISDFRSLSEDAQCLYVRMVNRKGFIFSRDTFSSYREIADFQGSLRELEDLNFVSLVQENDKASVIHFLTKTALTKWLKSSDLNFKSSESKSSLENLALENLSALDLEKFPDSANLVVQRRTDELEYLLFLYFGKIQQSLSLYTLRDLGIRKAYGLKTQFKPRFDVLQDAQAEYFFAKTLDALDEIETDEQIQAIFNKTQQFSSLKSTGLNLKNHLLLEMAQEVEERNPELALRVYSEASAVPAREKAVRLLFKLDRKEEARQTLEQIIENPWLDEELLFAEDFLNRKFEKKRRGYLTEALLNAKEVALSDVYFKKPETGVRDLYRAQGIAAHFSENFLWNGLFGLLFWDELFESENTAIYNQFERSPADLVSSEFYENHKESIEKKLLLLQNPKSAEFYILKMFSLHHGKLNDIFQWHPNLIPLITPFIKACSGKNLAHILRTMGKNYSLYHSGYPDLLILEKGNPRFIEVKAEGDSIRSKQLSKVRLLTEAGFEVEILKVRWQADPNQVYVVVDVETTGGTSHFHRVTEIGAVKIQGGQIIDEFQTLINPGRPIPKNITRITGISDEMVADAPQFSDVAEKFLEFTENCIFVAHNARFDYSFIQREFQRLDIQFVRPTKCTVIEMRRKFPGLASYSLKNLTQHFQISLDQHHRALCDAKAAAELLLLVNEKRRPNPIHYVRDEMSSTFPE